MPPQPTLRDGALDPGAEVVASAACHEERRVDPLDIDAAILHSLNIVRDLDQLARGEVRVGEGSLLNKLHGPGDSSLQLDV